MRPAAARFGGGGHDRAAGCTMSGDLVTAVRAVCEAMEEVLHAEVRA